MTRLKLLKAGARYRYPDGMVIEVLRVNASRAWVRPVGRVQTEFQTNGGDEISFTRRPGPFTIANNSVLEEVEDPRRIVSQPSHLYRPPVDDLDADPESDLTTEEEEAWKKLIGEGK